MNKYFAFAFSLLFVSLICAVLAIADTIIGMTENPPLLFVAAVAMLISGFIVAIIGFRRSDK